jgi:hypothetical protein
MAEDYRSVQRGPQPASSEDTATSAGGAAATITYPTQGAGIANVLSAIICSYSAAPTGGGLTISDGSDAVFALDITAVGPFTIPFEPPLIGTENNTMAITLAGGGGAVVGKLNCRHWPRTVTTVGVADVWSMDFSQAGNSAYAAVI